MSGRLESLEPTRFNDLNGAHPSTVREASRQASSTALSSEPVEESGRTKDRAGHGEPVEPLNDLNDFNARFPSTIGTCSSVIERLERALSANTWNHWNIWNRWNEFHPL
jgi:hypothetical protein